MNIPVTYNDLLQLLQYGLMPIVKDKHGYFYLFTRFIKGKGIICSKPTKRIELIDSIKEYRSYLKSDWWFPENQMVLVDFYGSMLTPHTKEYEEGEEVIAIRSDDKSNLIKGERYIIESFWGRGRWQYSADSIHGMDVAASHTQFMPVLKHD